MCNIKELVAQVGNIKLIVSNLSKMTGRQMDVTAAEEVAAVATTSITQPVAKEAVVEVIGHDQRKSDLIKS